MHVIREKPGHRLLGWAYHIAAVWTLPTPRLYSQQPTPASAIRDSGHPEKEPYPSRQPRLPT